MEEILTTAAISGDADLDASLRPRRLEEFVGQPTLKEQLALVLDGAKGRSASADHLLFSGHQWRSVAEVSLSADPDA